MNPLPSPNINPQPKIQKAMDDIPNTIKFFASMLTVFFERQSPDSSMAKPKFMKNTRKAVKRTHTVSNAILLLLIASAKLGVTSLTTCADGSCANSNGISRQADAHNKLNIVYFSAFLIMVVDPLNIKKAFSISQPSWLL